MKASDKANAEHGVLQNDMTRNWRVAKRHDTRVAKRHDTQLQSKGITESKA